VNAIHDGSLGATRRPGTLWGLARTGGLIGAAVLASILTVDLPIAAGRAGEAPPYVPAAETWIEPGLAAPRPDTSVEMEAVGHAATPRRTSARKTDRPAKERRVPRRSPPVERATPGQQERAIVKPASSKARPAVSSKRV
jgi:hypothetical protein